MSTLSTRDIEAMVAQFHRAKWHEMHFSVDGDELFLSIDGRARSSDGAQFSLQSIVTPHGALVAPAPPAHDMPTGWFTVLAPSLGSFYRAPTPGAPAFTDIGAHVSADSDLCVLEVMTRITALRAGVAGIVREVYAQDGELVEFEQPLFLIEPYA